LLFQYFFEPKMEFGDKSTSRSSILFLFEVIFKTLLATLVTTVSGFGLVSLGSFEKNLK
jgi:hypothetical protein